MANSLLRRINKFSLIWVLLGLIPSSLFSQVQSVHKRVEKNHTNYSGTSSIILQKKERAEEKYQSGYSQPQTEAMWDIQFAWRPADSTMEIDDNSTLAGAVWTGTEFWLSSWTSDTMVRIGENGSFMGIETISGIQNVRGLTWTGSLIYAANNSVELKGFDPQTKQLVDSIEISGPETYRFAAYDSLADNGNGGFYVGNFGTDIYLIDTLGQKIDTIPFSVHGRNTIYGAVVDHVSPGGPFLWVFDQPEFPSYAVISQLKLPEGIYTGFSRDVQGDLATELGAAGGLFIGQNIIPGRFTLGGILQNNLGKDVLFGYDLEYMSRQYDAGVVSLSINQRYTIFPRDQANIIFQGEVYNTGNDSIPSLEIDLTVENDTGLEVFSHQQNFSSLGSFDAVSFESNSWSPPYANHFLAKVKTNIDPLFDEFSGNDSIQIPVEISDSVYARDDGQILLGLSIGSTSSQKTIMGQSFQLKEPDYLTSITFTLVEPDPGMEVQVSIFGVDSLTGRPDQNIFYGRSTTYTITPEDALKGVTITLPIDSVPIFLPKGEFFIGVNQPGGSSLSLGLTFDIFTPKKTWVRSAAIAGGNWVNNEDLPGNPIPFVYALRPNLGPCFPTYMKATIEVTPDSGSDNGSAKVFATGGAGVYSYLWNDPFTQQTDSAQNLPGGFTYTCVISDTNGCAISVTTDTIPKYIKPGFNSLRLKDWNIYPNPSNQYFQVKLEFHKTTNYTLQLMDLQGIEVFRESFSKRINHYSSIDVSNLSPGLYIFRVHTSEGSMLKKLAITP